VRDEQERLLAAGGVVQAQVRVGEHEPFAVAGIGGIIVTRACRGRGLARLVIERVLEIAATLGPERAMLFCLPRNVALYEKFGFRLLAGPVRARQPEGTIELPMSAMWRPLRDGAGWPRGAVEVLGEPF
jgi:GNAT superfamily N-acetyltransferase